MHARTSMRRALPVLALFLAACAKDPDPAGIPDGSSEPPPDLGTQAPSGNNDTGSTKPPLEVLTEEVYVLFAGYDESEWMCTGTLIASDIVVTAAHCLDERRFENWRVIAPLLPGKPSSKASSVHLRSNKHDDPAAPDVGFLVLEDPIEAPNYAQLTDVSERIENGEKLEGVAIVRSAEEAEADFMAVSGLAIRSTTDIGYDHGFATQLFSHGGDSGAGLFLVENGRATHKLIGIAREPDPEVDLDHFTRVDSDFLEWLAQNR